MNVVTPRLYTPSWWHTFYKVDDNLPASHWEHWHDMPRFESLRMSCLLPFRNRGMGQCKNDRISAISKETCAGLSWIFHLDYFSRGQSNPLNVPLHLNWTRRASLTRQRDVDRFFLNQSSPGKENGIENLKRKFCTTKYSGLQEEIHLASGWLQISEGGLAVQHYSRSCLQKGRHII